MAKKSKSYWEKRQGQWIKNQDKMDAAFAKKLEAEYKRTALELEKDIASYFQKYGKDNVIEFRTMLQSLSKKDRDLLFQDMDRFAKKYPQYKDLMPVRESVYKLNKLQGLHYSTQMKLLELGAVEQVQFFSQDDTGGSNPSDESKEDNQDDLNTDKDDDTSQDGKPKFTQKQLDKIVQDRVNRLEKDKQDAIDEAKKLAKMSADQKKEYEFEKLKRENEELKAAKNKYELGKEASRILSESGINASDEILDFVVKENAEKTNEAVKTFTTLIDEVSDEKMKEKLKGKPPKKEAQQGTGFKNPWSKEHLNLTEQARVLQENPELAKQLKSQA